MRQISPDITCKDDIILMSHSVKELFAKINFSIISTEQIQMITKGQIDNATWFHSRKGTSTTSKSHEIKTSMSFCQKRRRLCEHVELMLENIWLNHH